MNPPLRHSASGIELKSRSLEMASSAFVTRDIARSRDAHTPPSPSKRKVEDEPHKRYAGLASKLQALPIPLLTKNNKGEERRIFLGWKGERRMKSLLSRRRRALTLSNP